MGKLEVGRNDLESFCKQNNRLDLLNEWDYEGNGELLPSMITFKSNKKVWWKCKNNHKWLSAISNRHQRGCPYCSGKKAILGINDIQTLYPEISKEWHPTKNGKLLPNEFTSGSAVKVWWMCSEGHEWQTNINNRTMHNTGCPFCSGRNAIVGKTDLQTLFPDIAKEWHPVRNGNLKPYNMSAHSAEKIWWIDKLGHEWKTSIDTRTSQKSGCPYCSNKKILVGFNDLLTTHPQIAKEWNYEKNGDLKPTAFNSGSAKKVWWLCPKGHEYQCTISNRTSLNQSCPVCSNKQILSGQNDFETWCKQNNKEILLEEWNYEKNGDLKPCDVVPGTQKSVWWICSEGHEWKAAMASRAKRGSGCPYCVGQRAIKGKTDLQTTKPELAKEWHPTKNGILKPTDVKAMSNQKVWWKCSKGHEWEAVIAHRAGKKHLGCPYCSNRKIIVGYNDLTTTHPEVAKLWHPTKNGNLKPTDVTHGRQKKIWWLCPRGHEWYVGVSDCVKSQGCPKCSGIGTSLPEQGIAFYLENACKVNQRAKILNCEIDIFLPEYNIGVEYDGKYYHTIDTAYKEAKKDNKLLNAGIKIIRIKESDFNDVKDNVIYYAFDNLQVNYEWAIKELIKILATLTSNEQFYKINVDVKRDLLKIRERLNLYENEKSLLSRNPFIAKEWNYEKNGNLKPEMFSYGSHMKVWWKCEHNHEWQQDIKTRAIRNIGCPFCAGQRAIKGVNDLETVFPGIAKEWHPTKNGDLKPSDIMSKSNKKVWWLGKCGHEWETMVISRTDPNKKTGCPYCSNQKVLVGYNDLATINPEIAKEWHPTNNNDLKPSDFVSGSNKKVWWKCDKCGNEWQAIISSRTKQNTGCPSCTKRRIK